MYCMRNLQNWMRKVQKKSIRIIIRRLVRALEILEVTGQTKQDHEQQQGNQPMYHSVIIGLRFFPVNHFMND